jgi:exopolysaccharide production protein ExoZ
MVFVTSTRDRSPRQFLEARATRIVPIYWFDTLACFALLCIAPRLFRTNEASASKAIVSEVGANEVAPKKSSRAGRLYKFSHP